MHLEPKDFNYDIATSVIAEANKYMNDSQSIILISTVMPGTIRKQIIPLVTNTKFVYNPYLIAMGTIRWDMVNPEMIMIGTEDGSETGLAGGLSVFYDGFMENNPKTIIGTWEEVETMKIFYNTFISTKVVLTNMIMDVALKVGNINVDVVTDALKICDKRILGPQYMTAGMPDGGSCHPRDNIAMRWLAQEYDLGYDLFNSVMSAREVQAKNMADAVVLHAKAHDMKCIIVGKAYKVDVEYEHGSGSILVGHYVQEAGVELHYYDTHTGDYYQSDVPAVYLLAHNFGKISEENTTNSVRIPDGSIVIDPWRQYENMNCTVIHFGNTRIHQ
jgi:UDPglucose 6-dehydrogenase